MELYNNRLLFTWTGGEGGQSGYQEGPANEAKFHHPYDLVIGDKGVIFMTDFNNNCVRKITPDGQVTTHTGSGKIGYIDGKGTEAAFNRPRGIAIDSFGNLFVADTMNHKIRKVTPEGVTTTVAGCVDGDLDDPAVSRIRYPRGVAVGNDGCIYISDSDNSKIKKITLEGQVITIAGGEKGDATGDALKEAKFNTPHGLLVHENYIIVADTYNNKIKKIQDGQVITIAGGNTGCVDGKCADAEFSFPYAVKMAKNRDIIVADYKNHKIRKITEDGYVETIGGNSSTSVFSSPTGLCIDEDGAICVADTYNHRLRKIILKETMIENWTKFHFLFPGGFALGMKEFCAILHKCYPQLHVPSEIKLLISQAIVAAWLQILFSSPAVQDESMFIDK